MKTVNRRTHEQVVIGELTNLFNQVQTQQNELNSLADRLEKIHSSDIAVILRREANAGLWVKEAIEARIKSIQAGVAV